MLFLSQNSIIRLQVVLFEELLAVGNLDIKQGVTQAEE